MKELKTISDVLERLDGIIQENEQNQDTLGYFAVLYRRVTWRIKEEIEAGNFEDNARMEQLDVVFAKIYIDAYDNYRNDMPVSLSWEKAFKLSGKFWPVVMQHLLIGMNAHINLDLGIAAALVSGKDNIEDLRNDFYKINAILASLVDEVQQNLSTVWPPLRRILQRTGHYDNLLVNFSMRIARDGAWNFAKTLAVTPGAEREECIKTRDKAVARVAGIITDHRPWVRLLLGIIRLGELGTVSGKMKKMKFRNSDIQPVTAGNIS